MTTAERLIKQAADVRISQIRQEPLPLPEREVPWDKLPAGVRRTAADYLHHSREAERLKNILDGWGWDVPYDRCEGGVKPEHPKVLHRDHTPHSRECEQIKDKRNARLFEISRLKNDAAIRVLGLDAKAAQPIVAKLRDDLAKV